MIIIIYNLFWKIFFQKEANPPPFFFFFLNTQNQKPQFGVFNLIVKIFETITAFLVFQVIQIQI